MLCVVQSHLLQHICYKSRVYNGFIIGLERREKRKAVSFSTAIPLALVRVVAGNSDKGKTSRADVRFEGISLEHASTIDFPPV